jgi:hypothetical protein
MRNDRSPKKEREQKDIIVRTRKGNVVGCYHFATIGCNKDAPSGRPKFGSFTKMAECVEINWNVGGDVFITLRCRHPNGFNVEELVVFDKSVVTAIEIYTDFENLRNHNKLC